MAASPWQNPNDAQDVNADGAVTPVDALGIVNALNDGGPRLLSSSLLKSDASAATLGDYGYIDTDGNGLLSAADVITVVNRINAAKQDPVAQYRARATTLAGEEITGPIDAGTSFFLEVLGEDIRDQPQGIFSGYVDVNYPASLVSIDGAIEYGDKYDQQRRGDLSTPGLIDEGGAFGLDTLRGGGEFRIFRVQMIADADGTAEFTLDPADDVGSETLVHGLNSDVSAETNYLGFTLQIGEATTTPDLAISDAQITEGDSGTTDLIFTVSISEASDTDVTFDFATSDDTATADVDYTPAAGSGVILAGETTAQIVVPVIGDEDVESDETFNVALSNVSGANVVDGEAVGTILDDDQVVLPSLTIDNVSIEEGNEGAKDFVFTVTLSEASSEDVTFDFATADDTAIAGEDYTAASGSATIPAGGTTVTIAVSVTGDTTTEPDETFTLALSNVVGATPPAAPAIGTIINDDAAAPTLSIDDVSANEGDSGVTAFTFTVSLSVASDETVTVDYAAVDDTAIAGEDYATASGTLTFAPGETTQSVVVNVSGDTTVEPDETFFVNLSNPGGATLADDQGVGTIVNDDVVAGNEIVRFSAVPTNEAGDAITQIDVGGVFYLSVFARDLRTPEQGVFSGYLDVVYSAGLVDVNGSIEFGTLYPNRQRGDTSVDGLIDEAGAFDGDSPLGPGAKLLFRVPMIAEAAGTADFTLDGADDATNDVLVYGSNDLVLSEDIDFVSGQLVINAVGGEPTLSISDVSQAEGNSGLTAFVFTVSLNQPTDGDVTFDYSTLAGTATEGQDFTPASGSGVILAGETSTTIEVSVVGDANVEPDETFQVMLGNPSGAMIGDGVGDGVILNDDQSSGGVGSISGVVFSDNNNNGVQEAPETGIDGVIVRLSGTAQSGGSIEMETTTDLDGAFSFADVPVGNYTLTEVQPGFYTDGVDFIAGGAPGVAGDDVITDIALADGANLTGYHFGEWGLRYPFFSRRLLLASLNRDDWTSTKLAESGSWIAFNEGFEGTLSVQAKAADDTVRLLWYNDDVELISSSTSADGETQMLLTAVPGETYFLRVVSDSGQAELTFEMLDDAVDAVFGG